MNKTMTRFALLCCALLLCMFYLFPSNSYACTCVEPPAPKEALERSYAVFSGRVSDIIIPSEGDVIRSTGPIEVWFDVKEVWKGNIEDKVMISSSENGGMCGFSFQDGNEYIVYASGDESLIQVSLCSRTALLSNAEEDLQSLGAGTVNPDYENSDHPSDTGSEPDREAKISAAWWIVGLIVVIVIVAWIGVWRSRRS